MLDKSFEFEYIIYRRWLKGSIIGKEGPSRQDWVNNTK
jgi:hypothetical protein